VVVYDAGAAPVWLPRSNPRVCHSQGKFLAACGEKLETISVYAIDQASGALRMLNKYPVGKGANWLEIVSFD